MMPGLQLPLPHRDAAAMYAFSWKGMRGRFYYIAAAGPRHRCQRAQAAKRATAFFGAALSGARRYARPRYFIYRLRRRAAYFARRIEDAYAEICSG